jgi:hypothetical protein
MLTVVPPAASPGRSVTVFAQLPYTTPTPDPFTGWWHLESYELFLYPLAFPWPIPLGVLAANPNLPGFYLTTVTIPNLPAGPCRLSAQIDLYAPPAATFTFQVLPLATATLNPWFGAPSQIIQVNGSGFGANESVVVLLLSPTGEPQFGTLMAGPTGSIVGNVTVPSVAVGMYQSIAMGQTSGISCKPSPFALGDPLGCAPAVLGLETGAGVQALVQGFKPGENVTLSLVDPTGVATVVGKGPFTFPVANIPFDDSKVTPGKYSLVGVGASTGLNASSPFYVLPPATISPSTATPGFPVTVGLKGAPPNSPFSIYMTPTVAEVSGKTDPLTGDVSETFPMPSVPPPPTGAPYIASVQSQVKTVPQSWASYSSYKLAPLPPIALSPASGIPGTHIHIIGGSGFPAGDNFAVSTGGIVAGYGTVKSDGTIDITVPALVQPGGTYAVQVIGSTGQPLPWTQSAVFTSVALPPLTISPNPATAGSMISVTGSGYPATGPTQSLTLDVLIFQETTVPYTPTYYWPFSYVFSDGSGNLDATALMPTYIGPGMYDVRYTFTLWTPANRVFWTQTFRNAFSVVSPVAGVGELQLYNCSSATPPRSVDIWVQDLTAGTGWTDLGTLDPQWDSSGTCPAMGATPFTVTFQSGHLYEVVAVDCGNDSCNCDGTNDPTLSACIRWSDTITGATGGPVLQANVI